MPTTLEVLFAPAEFGGLARSDLSQTVCVVFDVLRATSTMVTALDNGAAAIIPVAEISEALALRAQQPEVLLAGERNGLRIRADLTGGVEFHLGNSPREFTPERVRGKTIVMTTTNGTRALRACAAARAVLIASLLNLRVTAEHVQRLRPARLLLICSGTLNEAAYEDTLCAGAFCDLIWTNRPEGDTADSAAMALELYRQNPPDLSGLAEHSRNARRLLANPDLREDVRCCLQRDVMELVAHLGRDGLITKVPA